MPNTDPIYPQDFDRIDHEDIHFFVGGISDAFDAPDSPCAHGENMASPDFHCEECKYWDAREAAEEARFDAMHDGDFDEREFWV
jgi:hypothetical protein